MEDDQLLGRAADFCERIGLEAAGLEPLDHAGLRLSRHFAHLAPGIGEKAERTRSGNACVLLAQGAGRRIARIGEDRLAGRLLALVERKEIGLGHVDLAAHFRDLRHALAFEPMRHILQRADIGGDVLAFAAVAAGGGGDERAVLVAQRH